MITLEQAKEIARGVDPEAELEGEFPKGFLFSRPTEVLIIGDPGFAVAREDGRVLHGITAREFLYELNGIPLTEEDE